MKNITCSHDETILLRIVKGELWLSVDNIWLSWGLALKRGNGKCNCWHYCRDFENEKLFMKLVYNAWACMIEEWEIGMCHGLRELLWVEGIYVILWNNIEERKWENVFIQYCCHVLEWRNVLSCGKSLHCIFIQLSLFLHYEFQLKIFISWKKITLWQELWKCVWGKYGGKLG